MIWYCMHRRLDVENEVFAVFFYYNTTLQGPENMLLIESP